MKKSLTLAVGALVVTISAFVSGQTGAKNGEWPHWGADHGNTKYSPLDQINRDNVKNLRIAWRWKAENFGPPAEANLEATPLMVGGVLYTTAGTSRAVVAIDGATGETLWMYRLDEGERGDMAPRSVIEASSTGPTARGARSSSSRRGIAWCRSTRRPASPIRSSARTASSTCTKTSINRFRKTARSARARRPWS